jgi:hypothetical protein
MKSSSEGMNGTLSRRERLQRIRIELERRIDFDLEQGHGGHLVQADLNVLNRYSTYLAFRSAEMYRMIAILLSAMVAASAVVSLFVAHAP